jgi:glutathione synthase/RimK-type ligase-like ATP-grasp enzyme
VYDRYMPSPGRVRAATDALCERLTDAAGCLFVNDPRLARLTRNKWETAVALRDHPVLAPFIPRVHRLRWDQDTQQFLDTEPVVFVKPTEGARGLGVMRFEAGAMDYIVQEALDPLTYQGRVVDLRILMQRDGRGTWIIPPWIGRVGAVAEHRANLAVGGEAWPGHLVLELALADRPDRLREVEQQVGTILDTLPSALAEIAGPCGEMGVDLLVDQTGRVWCLEINPKPGFEGLRAIGRLIDRDLRGEALTRMADYIRWLDAQRQSGN